MSTRDVPGLLPRVVQRNPLAAGLGVLGVALVVDLLRRLLAGDLATATLATFLWDGVVFGMALGLAGIGLAMTYSILAFANFAHGDYITKFSNRCRSLCLPDLSSEIEPRLYLN